MKLPSWTWGDPEQFPAFWKPFPIQLINFSSMEAVVSVEIIFF